MRKVICILLLCWLPLSMVTAQVMSVKMMLNSHLGTNQIQEIDSTESCQDNTHQQKSLSSKSHKCTVCGSCVLASATATLGDFPTHIDSLKSPSKHLAFEPTFVSITPETFIKPPILN